MMSSPRLDQGFSPVRVHPAADRPSITSEGLAFMLDLEVILDFTCCHCGDPLGVTLKCTGPGLGTGSHAAATVKIPCPHCQELNRLIFTPEDGTLHQVSPVASTLLIPEPSFN